MTIEAKSDLIIGNNGMIFTIISPDFGFNFNFNFNLRISNFTLTPKLKLKLKLNPKDDFVDVENTPYFGLGR